MNRHHRDSCYQYGLAALAICSGVFLAVMACQSAKHDMFPLAIFLFAAACFSGFWSEKHITRANELYELGDDKNQRLARMRAEESQTQ